MVGAEVSVADAQRRTPRAFAAPGLFNWSGRPRTAALLAAAEEAAAARRRAPWSAEAAAALLTDEWWHGAKKVRRERQPARSLTPRGGSALPRSLPALP